MSDEPIRAREKCYPPVWLILIRNITHNYKPAGCGRRVLTVAAVVITISSTDLNLLSCVNA